MVNTRSADKQTHLKDFANGKKAPAPEARKAKTNKAPAAKKQSKISNSEDGQMLSPPGLSTKKRKSSPSNVEAELSKKAKTEENDDNPIIINRAPVLHLWGASVTHFLYPKLDWSTCLSAGSAISSICAVAKGRSIGTINEPDDTEERRKKKKKERKDEEGAPHTLEVMQFKLKHKDGKVHFSGKPQSSSENTLRTKYGERYDEVRTTFDEALQDWKGDEEELSKAAFGMYEEFRPNTAKGQKGWGRKGALDLNIIRKTVQKG
jgi:hypothetical protein